MARRDPTEILPDLLNIEINTIIKTNMTAEKAPSVPFALLDIIADYGRQLEAYGVKLAPYLAKTREQCLEEVKAAREQQPPKGPVDPTGLWLAFTSAWEQSEQISDDWKFEMSAVHNGWDTFERLRIATIDACAHLHEQSLGERELADRQILLTRISNNCARLKHIVHALEESSEDKRKWADFIPKTRAELQKNGSKRVPLGSLAFDDRVAIRKIWEMGTETVIAQTSIQLDGDVVTRLSPTLIAEYEAEVRSMLLRIHSDSTEIGIRHWQSLVKTVWEIAASVADKLTSLLRGRR